MLLMNETLEILILNILVELSAAVGRRFMNFVIKSLTKNRLFFIFNHQKSKSPKSKNNTVFRGFRKFDFFEKKTRKSVLKSDKNGCS